MKLKFTEPVFTQCRVCFKKYDMVEWGVDCPSCKTKKKEQTVTQKIKLIA